MPLVGGFSRGSPLSPASLFRRRSLFTSITLIGSQDLAIKSHQNLFTHSLTHSLILFQIHYLDIMLETCPCSPSGKNKSAPMVRVSAYRTAGLPTRTGHEYFARLLSGRVLLARAATAIGRTSAGGISDSRPPCPTREELTGPAEPMADRKIRACLISCSKAPRFAHRASENSYENTNINRNLYDCIILPANTNINRNLYDCIILPANTNINRNLYDCIILPANTNINRNLYDCIILPANTNINRNLYDCIILPANTNINRNLFSCEDLSGAVQLQPFTCGTAEALFFPRPSVFHSGAEVARGHRREWFRPTETARSVRSTFFNHVRLRCRARGSKGLESWPLRFHPTKDARICRLIGLRLNKRWKPYKHISDSANDQALAGRACLIMPSNIEPGHERDCSNTLRKTVAETPSTRQTLKNGRGCGFSSCCAALVVAVRFRHYTCGCLERSSVRTLQEVFGTASETRDQERLRSSRPAAKQLIASSRLQSDTFSRAIAYGARSRFSCAMEPRAVILAVERIAGPRYSCVSRDPGTHAYRGTRVLMRIAGPGYSVFHLKHPPSVWFDRSSLDHKMLAQQGGNTHLGRGSGVVEMCLRPLSIPNCSVYVRSLLAQRLTTSRPPICPFDAPSPSPTSGPSVRQSAGPANIGVSGQQLVSSLPAGSATRPSAELIIRQLSPSSRECCEKMASVTERRLQCRLPGRAIECGSTEGTQILAQGHWRMKANVPHKFVHDFMQGRATVAERFACLPPTKEVRVQCRATPDFNTSKSCRTMPLVGGFSRRYPRHQPRGAVRRGERRVTSSQLRAWTSMSCPAEVRSFDTNLQVGSLSKGHPGPTTLTPPTPSCRRIGEELQRITRRGVRSVVEGSEPGNGVFKVRRQCEANAESEGTDLRPSSGMITETSTLKSSTLAGEWARTMILNHDRPMRYPLHLDDSATALVRGRPNRNCSLSPEQLAVEVPEIGAWPSCVCLVSLTPHEDPLSWFGSPDHSSRPPLSWIGKFREFNDLLARLPSPVYTGDSHVCSLAADSSQFAVHFERRFLFAGSSSSTKARRTWALVVYRTPYELPCELSVDY
ncbi:hypothetical protein PR048_031681 [Dryococelus australis]|uniref:Uncharacterized protein n=1 Tax=Dryococelus australis TaxID=614101 RepID=A0ABQ9G600_9NEOP|nr:hypothetical protein PR048_031681 [Dryococelus australis]